MKHRNLYPDYSGNKFTFVTDGPLHLRQCLITECCKKGIQLPSYYHSYYDLRKEFSKFYGKDRVSGINEMLQGKFNLKILINTSSSSKKNYY